MLRRWTASAALKIIVSRSSTESRTGAGRRLGILLVRGELNVVGDITWNGLIPWSARVSALEIRRSRHRQRRAFLRPGPGPGTARHRGT